MPKPVNLPSIKKVRGPHGGPAVACRHSWAFPVTGWRCAPPCCAQENQGNDPTTQLVPPSSGSGSWVRPEDGTNAGAAGDPGARPPSAPAPTWGAAPRPGPAPVAGPWQPPGPAGSAQPERRGPGASYPVDRHLNPEEFPSLATAKAGVPAPRPKLAYEHGQVGVFEGVRPAFSGCGGAERDLDRHATRHATRRMCATGRTTSGRAPTGQGPIGELRSGMIWASPDLAPGPRTLNTRCPFSPRRGHGGRDDDRYAGEFQGGRGPGPAPWDHRSGERGGRGYDHDAYGPPRPGGPPGGHEEEDFRGGRAGPGFETGYPGPYGGPPRGRDAPPLPSRRGYGGPPGPPHHERYHDGPGGYDPYDERSLFPPPPPPRHPHAGRNGEAGEEEVDPERLAFEAELARVAAELERVRTGRAGGGGVVRVGACTRPGGARSQHAHCNRPAVPPSAVCVGWGGGGVGGKLCSLRAARACRQHFGRS